TPRGWTGSGKSDLKAQGRPSLGFGMTNPSAGPRLLPGAGRGRRVVLCLVRSPGNGMNLLTHIKSLFAPVLAEIEPNEEKRAGGQPRAGRLPGDLREGAGQGPGPPQGGATGRQGGRRQAAGQ